MSPSIPFSLGLHDISIYLEYDLGQDDDEYIQHISNICSSEDDNIVDHEIHCIIDIE